MHTCLLLATQGHLSKSRLLISGKLSKLRLMLVNGKLSKLRLMLVNGKLSKLS